jgi:hypothetical protein
MDASAPRLFKELVRLIKALLRLSSGAFNGLERALRGCVDSSPVAKRYHLSLKRALREP